MVAVWCGLEFSRAVFSSKILVDNWKVDSGVQINVLKTRKIIFLFLCIVEGVEVCDELEIRIKRVVEAAQALAKNGESEMDTDSLFHWMEALKYDRQDVVQEVLERCSPNARNVLLNGCFIYNTASNHWLQFSVKACKNVMEGTQWHRPLVLLMTCLSWKTLKFLFNGPFRESMNVFIRDDGDSNIIHALILSSKCSTEKEFLDLYHFVMDCLDLETRRTLLMQENAVALRPLELSVISAQLGLTEVSTCSPFSLSFSLSLSLSFFPRTYGPEPDFWAFV